MLNKEMQEGGIKGLLIQTDSAVTLLCPRCGKVGTLDDDQLHGRVSTRCFNEQCDYHETVDWAKKVRELGEIGYEGFIMVERQMFPERLEE